MFEALAQEEPDRWETDLYSPRPGTSLLIATPLMGDGFLIAVDAKTGRHKWDFHTIPQSADEFGADTWLFNGPAQILCGMHGRSNAAGLLPQAAKLRTTGGR